MDSEVVIHLDLYSFEEPLAENSKYILTSPRSLEPVELLHKPLSDFEDEYVNIHGKSPSQATVRRIYQEYERQRLRKLRICREERERIIRNPSNRSKFLQICDKHSVLDSKHSDEVRPTSEYRSAEQWIDDAPRWTDILRNEASDEEYEDRDEPNVYPSKQRGASVTEFLRNGSSSPTIENRALELFESPVREGTRSNSNYIWAKDEESREDQTSPLTRIARQTYGETTYSSDKTYQNRLGSPQADKQFTVHQLFGKRRPQSAWQDIDTKQMPDETSGRRLSSLSVGSGSQMRRQRSLSVDTLKSELPSHIAKGAAKLSEKDQRLLNIMVAKANQDDMERRIHRSSELDWLDKRKLENEIRKTRAKQQQMILADKLRENEMKKESMAKQRKRAEDEDRLMKESFSESKSNRWKQEYTLQLQIKNNKLLLKKMQEEEKKRKQEENLAKAEEEKQFMRNLAHMGLSDRHQQAIRNKELLQSEERTQRHYRNMEKKQQHKLRMETLKQQIGEDQAMLRASIEGKDDVSQETYQKFQKKREMEMTLNRYKKMERKERQEEYLRQMHKDIEVWQKELKQLQDVNQERAEQSRKKNTSMKGQKAYEQRLQKEELHAMNKAKMDEDERLRQQEYQNYLSIKDERSKMVMEDKEEITRTNQEAARASRAMRDLIKEQMVKSSFDKMAEEAERMARIERKGFQSHKKNLSTVKLG